MANIFTEFIPWKTLNFMRRPLIFPFIGLIAGTVIGNYYDVPYSPLLAGLLIALVLLLFFVLKGWKTSSFIMVICFTLIIGLFNIQKQQYFIDENTFILNHTDSGKKTLEGVIIESPLSYPDQNILIVRCLRLRENNVYTPVQGNIRLIVPAGLNFSYGDFIRFQTLPRKIRNFNNPGGFDYQRYLQRKGIYATGFIADASGIILLRKESSGNIRLRLEHFRTYLKQIIYANANSPAREIIEAMLLGDQYAISAEIRENFNKTGTSHILSISGLHVGMVAAMAFFLVTIILKSSEYLMLRLNIIKVSAMMAFILVMVYALIAGMGITVIRSALMALIFLLALIIGRQHDFYNTITLAGLIILIVSPEALFDISFQLSFAAVLAIIYVVPHFSNLPLLQLPSFPGWSKSIIRYIYMSALVCLAATIGTLPLIIFYFNRVSSLTIIANLIIVPILGTLALAIMMLMLLAAFFSSVAAGFFVQVASFFVDISVEIINRLAAISWSSFSLIKPSIPEIILFYILIILILQLIDFRNSRKSFSSRHPLTLKYAILTVLLFFIGDAAYLILNNNFSHKLSVTAIDVGQGSATLLRLPGGKNMLIDGGGFKDSAFDAGKMIIAPYLYHERISKIDTIILTHPHPDHFLGINFIIENFNVRQVWTNGMNVDDDNYQNMLKTIRQKNIKIISCSAKDQLVIPPNIRINFFWPLSPSGITGITATDVDINDHSLVFQIKYGNIAFLFTGDISRNIEYELIRKGKDMKSDVLFAPHHGSATSSSSDFIRNVSGRWAVISAGKGNVFRLPHPTVLQRYYKEGIQILRTDKDGAISFTTDGTSLTKETFFKGKEVLN